MSAFEKSSLYQLHLQLENIAATLNKVELMVHQAKKFYFLQKIYITKLPS